MKITFIGHASILVESKGISILSDPWWRGPCFGAQWWLYPEPYLAAVENRKIDYIYVSHGHHDHFHPTTLKTFNRGSKVLVAKDADLRDAIEKMGFDVIEVNKDEEYQLGGPVSCRIVATEGGDTLMAISDGIETCLNLNDSLHASSSLVQDKILGALKNLYPRIDYVFCGYGTASHFPNCYTIPGKNTVKTAVRRQSYFNQAWARVIRHISPKFAFPFAADVVFLDEDLFWCNEPVHNSERPTQVFEQLWPNSPTIPIDIAPGFTIADGNVLVNNLRRPIRNEVIKDFYDDAIRRVRNHRQVEYRSVQEVLGFLKENIGRVREYLEGFEGEYKCLIKFRGCNNAIEICKKGKNVSAIVTQSNPKDNYDLIYTTRLQYLKRSLTTAYGHEILFVGSGGIFEYIETSRINSNIHREIMVVMRRLDESPRRASQSRTLISMAKRFMKKMIGHSENDLYELGIWTIFDERLPTVQQPAVPIQSVPRT